MPKTFTDSPHRPQRVYSRVPLPSQFILLARPASQSFLIVREAQLDTVRVNSIPVLLVRDRLTTARDQRPSTLIPTPAHQHNPFFPTTLSLSLSQPIPPLDGDHVNHNVYFRCTADDAAYQPFQRFCINIGASCLQVTRPFTSRCNPRSRCCPTPIGFSERRASLRRQVYRSDHRRSD
jgi:hypothetical protein